LHDKLLPSLSAGIAEITVSVSMQLCLLCRALFDQHLNVVGAVQTEQKLTVP